MDSNFCKFEIYDSSEQNLLNTLTIPVSQCNEAYAVFAIDTGNVVKVYDNEGVLRINSKLLNSITQTQ